MKQKNFKEIYDLIYQKCGKEIEKLRKQTLMKRIIVILLPIAILVVGIKSNGIFERQIIFFPLIIVAIIVCFIAIFKISRKYKKAFKENVIDEIVRQSNSNNKYMYDKGISQKEYSESGFDYGWDIYSSEDVVVGELEDGSSFKMGQVHTKEKHETIDSYGRRQTTYVTTFCGLYGIIQLKTKTKADFIIKGNSLFSKFNKDRIEMESSEFEKYYDVYSGSGDNQIRQNAMELLTPEVIEEFIKIRNLFNTSLNLRVYNSRIYFRIGCGNIFEAPTFKNSFNFQLLYKYFLIIDVPRMIYEMLIDNIIVMYGNQDDREKRNLVNMTDEEKQEYLKSKQEQEKESYFSTK